MTTLQTPTTQTLADNIVAQLAAAFSQQFPLMPKAFARVLGKVFGAVLILVYKYAGFSLLQQFIRYASAKETEVNGRTIVPLVELGREIGVGDPFDGVRAELVTQITVLNQTGSLPANTQFLRAETGVIYLSTAAVPLDAATKEVTVRASSDPAGGAGVGDIGNLEPGDELEIANTPANVGPTATVLSTAVIGDDAETVDVEYRARVLRRSQRKPQGGAYADYRIWGEAVPGVANIYPYTGDPGQVDIFVECDEDLDPDGIPDAGLLSDVADAINFDEDGLATNRSANAAINVLPITRTEFEVVVGNLDAPDVPAVRAEIEAGLVEYMRSAEPFILGLSVLPRLDSITQGAIGGVVNAIANAAGGTVTTVELKLAGESIPAYTIGLNTPGEKAKLVTPVTWE